MTALIDEVYDVLEGPLAEVIYLREFVVDPIDGLVFAARVREVRAAVMMLSALMRDGHAWRPAEDGYEASEWRDLLLAIYAQDYKPEYRALVVRELDEFVSLAASGPRRALPMGAFERVARKAGVERYMCRTWARESHDDCWRGWTTCEHPGALVRIPLAMGESLEHVHRAVLGAVTEAGESVRQQDAITPLRVEYMIQEARRAIGAETLRRHIETPVLRKKLGAPELN